MSRYLDLNYLKSLGIKPMYFGLGFIQLKLNDTERLHFWIDEGFVGEEEVHDHRYSFESKVLQGRLEHYTFAFEPALKGQWEKHLVSCDPNKKVPQHVPQRGHLIETSRYELAPGSWYKFMKGEFHQAYAAPHTVTFVTRDEGHRAEFAHVIRGRGDRAVCPFSAVLSQETLWDKIAFCINQPTPEVAEKAKPGYHLASIPKGELGEISKIVEEALELQDFHAQGTSVGGLVELSDLIGAVEAYLAKNHPTIGLNDLKIFADITKRSFVNGHRS